MRSPDRIVYTSDTLRIGVFRCQPWHPHFEDSGPITGHLIVFPRTSVCITHAGRKPIVTTPNMVMLYNDQQVYRRGKISERGDVCEWFEFAPHSIIEALRPHDPAVDQRWNRPFVLTHGPSNARVYLLQRMIIEHVLGAVPLDQLYVEEAALAVLRGVTATAYQTQAPRASNAAPATERANADVVDAVKKLLGVRFGERLSLAQIACEVQYSPYHLCRIFKRRTGASIHSYLNQIRLHTALEYLEQPATDLARLSLDLGYSSHSHFTLAFRRAFGVSPSTFRQGSSASRARDLSKILIA